ncbi:MAG TPA: AI-2E family transporter, partial [Thermoanaerobaculia bacterium]|nr:AI-2E family transporter [Thermoanaerobaculia bacterium]
AVPPAVLALVQLGTGGAVAVLAGFLLANLVIGNIVEPNLMGRSLGLSPLVVLLSLVFWGWLWGMIGTLLAVPLAMILKILVENSPNLSWIARLMDARPHPEPAPKEP